jgi:hypothetical protein
MLDELHARYADGVNRKRADLLAPLFTTEAVWDLGEYGEVVGRDAIADWLGELFTHWAAIFHTIHSKLVEPTADGTGATARLWFTEFGIRDGAPRAMCGVFHDRYVLGAEGTWQFASRRHDITWRLVDGTHHALPFPGAYDHWVP